MGNCKIETEDAPRVFDGVRRQTACLRMMTRPTIQWTRGETALLLKLASLTRSCAYSVSPASSQPFDASW
ncbi:MAG: hypothetical protein ACR2MG_15695 [Pyrinomonadaceae bacterium]